MDAPTGPRILSHLSHQGRVEEEEEEEEEPPPPPLTYRHTSLAPPLFYLLLLAPRIARWLHAGERRRPGDLLRLPARIPARLPVQQPTRPGTEVLVRPMTRLRHFDVVAPGWVGGGALDPMSKSFEGRLQ